MCGLHVPGTGWATVTGARGLPRGLGGRGILSALRPHHLPTLQARLGGSKPFSLGVKSKGMAEGSRGATSAHQLALRR